MFHYLQWVVNETGGYFNNLISANAFVGSSLAKQLSQPESNSFFVYFANRADIW